ncbi:MAG: aspartate aminotransferase family protein [Bacteroidetes bacterium]|nr:MAG: aspartate aminotransferase family protein [Bacteroidota bacterium]
MKLFDVYPIYDISVVKGKGSYVWDEKGTKYLDLYGGHAVISIGHSHPHYVQMLKNQLDNIGFYSNFVRLPLQEQLAEKLGKVSNCEDYQLFLSNSGAEANENALKLASFATCRKKIIAFSKSFHGRTSLAVSCTDNPSIIAPVNQTDNVIFSAFNDINALETIFKMQGQEIAAVIIEGIQGVGGINIASDSFLQKIRSLCTQYGAVFIADSVQCGYGRSGKFFAHDFANVKADIYCTAKGMGNGFPIGGTLIASHLKPKMGMLGTTFGGNHLACTAALAVLDVIEQENLIANAEKVGNYVMSQLKSFSEVKEVKGHGLMIGIELFEPCDEIRKSLIFNHHVFTGSSSNKNLLRLLPSLAVSKTEMDIFLEKFSLALQK